MKRNLNLELAMISATLGMVVGETEDRKMISKSNQNYRLTEREIEIIHKVEQNTIAKAKAKRERKALGRKHYETHKKNKSRH